MQSDRRERDMEVERLNGRLEEVKAETGMRRGIRGISGAMSLRDFSILIVIWNMIVTNGVRSRKMLRNWHARER